jgi:hypothetical protein
MTTRETLQIARAALMQQGWCQGSWQDENGRLCTVGALRRAAHETHEQFAMEAYELLCQLSGAYHLASWNDCMERTLQDVLALFDAAIVIAQQQEAHDLTRDEVLV